MSLKTADNSGSLSLLTPCLFTPLVSFMLSWYALHVRSRRETYVATLLKGKVSDVYVPLTPHDPRHRVARRTSSYALFPGYVFCRFDVSEPETKVVATPYVISFVGPNARPTPIPDSEVDAVRRVIDSGLPVMANWDVGLTVQIFAGPLAGLCGVLTRDKAGCRVTIQVHLLNRGVSVAIDRSLLRPVAVETARPRSRLRSR